MAGNIWSSQMQRWVVELIDGYLALVSWMLVGLGLANVLGSVLIIGIGGFEMRGRVDLSFLGLIVIVIGIGVFGVFCVKTGLESKALFQEK